jgi:hypothetical protein
MLHEGKIEDFGKDTYRIIFNEIPGPKGTIVIGPLIDELGQECIVGRPVAMSAIKSSRKRELRVVVCGYSNRHPFYQEADEYWGLCPPMKRYPDWAFQYKQEMERKLPGCKFANSDYAGVDFLDAHARKYGPLPKPSKAATEKALEMVTKRPFITICPRNVPHPSRDFKAWQDVVDGILGLGADVISCTPLDASYKPTGVRFLQEMVDLNDLLDVELALHGMADCCVASNTGATGIMIYAGAKVIVNVGGTGSYAPGWEGFRDAVAKENGIEPTRIVVTEGLDEGAMYGFDIPMEKHKEMAKQMVKHVEFVLSVV